MKKILAVAVLAGFLAGTFAPTADAAEKDGKKRDPEAVFKKLDKDGDGKLTFDEYKGKAEGKKAEAAEKRFKKMDTNEDQALSLDEFKAGIPKKKKS